MGKKYLFLFLILIFFVFNLFSQNLKSNPQTTLIIIDEEENNTFLNDIKPVSDGILDALWSRDDYIFFDINISSPLVLNNDSFDINPFKKSAMDSGADFILMIKINYTFGNENNILKVKIDNYYYNLYSVKDDKIVRKEKKELKIDEIVKKETKNNFLKKVGISILNEIYK